MLSLNVVWAVERGWKFKVKEKHVMVLCVRERSWGEKKCVGGGWKWGGKGRRVLLRVWEVVARSVGWVSGWHCSITLHDTGSVVHTLLPFDSGKMTEVGGSLVALVDNVTAARRGEMNSSNSPPPLSTAFPTQPVSRSVPKCPKLIHMSLAALMALVQLGVGL